MEHLPPPCKGGCGRPIRPMKTKAADHPGTKAQAARGYCFKCYGDLPKVNGKAPEACKHCRCKLRPNSTKLKDFPDTRPHQGKGLCNLCHQRWRRGVLAEGAPVGDPASTALRWSRSTEAAALRAAREVAAAEPKVLTDPGLVRFRAEREKRKKAAALRDAWIAQEAARRRFIASRRTA